MYDSHTPLCCCEYFNIDQERSHILACCCNCQDLDESFESLITGRQVSQRNQEGLMATLQDRFRIPWRGGARQISWDSILAIALIPLSILCAAFNLYSTIVTLLLELLIVSYIYHKYPKSFFFRNLAVAILIVQYFIFQIVVVPFLEILVEENVSLSVLILFMLFCVYMIKRQSNKLHDIQNGFLKSENGRCFHCSTCQIAVAEWDHHNVWINSCIGQHNQCYYVLCLIFAIAALLYSSNLTLTSVCHPFTFYKSILLPDDCSDVYMQYELSLAFVSAIHNIIFGCILILTLFKQLILITFGISTEEWKNYTFMQKICCICANRPYSRGFIRNWFRILCVTQRNY